MTRRYSVLMIILLSLFCSSFFSAQATVSDSEQASERYPQPRRRRRVPKAPRAARMTNTPRGYDMNRSPGLECGGTCCCCPSAECCLGVSLASGVIAALSALSELCFQQPE